MSAQLRVLKGAIGVHGQGARQVTPFLPVLPGLIDIKQKPWEGVAGSHFTPENDSREKTFEREKREKKLTFQPCAAVHEKKNTRSNLSHTTPCNKVEPVEPRNAAPASLQGGTLPVASEMYPKRARACAQGVRIRLGGGEMVN